jgi:2-amino-4-hydroxy-6-hydroxymethyldihydropteridine diphosphokinase
MSYWVTAFLGLGSNLPGDGGTVLENLVAARWELGEIDALRIVDVSPVYGSAPWGVAEQPDYQNAVLKIETLLAPSDLLEAAKDVEHCLGRRPSVRWGPRRIDIDILLYGMQRVATSELLIPHARLLERAFAVIPVLDLDPEVRMPEGQQVCELVNEAALRASLTLVGPKW